MKNILNLIGKRFNRLTVIGKVNNNKFGKTQWECLCDCGNKIIVVGGSLKSKNTKSCGCLNIEKSRERIIKQSTTHNMSNHKLYNTWQQMKYRCYNLNNNCYKYYGGRGIFVCRRWRNSLNNFIKDVGSKPKGKTMDRINNNQSYGPWNIKWSTHTEQMNNRGRY